jgi:hypothetical protein
VAIVGLLALDGGVGEILAAALRDEGHAARLLAFGPDVVRALARQAVDVLVLDGHEYVNTKHLLEDLRVQRETRALPVVVLGPARPSQVPDLPDVTKLGPRFDLHAVLTAVHAAVLAAPDVPNGRHSSVAG